MAKHIKDEFAAVHQVESVDETGILTILTKNVNFLDLNISKNTYNLQICRIVLFTFLNKNEIVQ